MFDKLSLRRVPLTKSDLTAISRHGLASLILAADTDDTAHLLDNLKKNKVNDKKLTDKRRVNAQNSMVI